MAVVINGDTGISPVTASGTSASVDGMTVGRGGGEVATNTAVGASALQANTSGANNTAVGYQSLYTNITGVNNVAIGGEALKLNTTDYCTAVGYRALLNNSTGARNSAFGHYAGNGNTTGGYNTFIGSYAGESNTTGSNNTALGYFALDSNTTASYNTAVGYQSGYSNLLGSANTFLGYQAGYSFAASSATSTYNTFLGYSAGYLATTGTNNTFVGNGAGQSVTTGGKNTILGNYGGNSSGLDIRTASNNIVLSDGDGTPRQYIDGSGNVYFNHGSATTVSPAPSGISMASAVNIPLQIYMLKQTQVEAHIGFKSSTDTNFYVGTSGGGGSGGIGVYGLYQQNVTNSWTAVSDERLKTELQPIENALEKVANVRTVTGRYTYDEENGVTRRLPFLIAQDFVTALPEAVDRQDPNKLGLSYSDTIVLAFAAIKELKAEFDAYKATHP